MKKAFSLLIFTVILIAFNSCTLHDTDNIKVDGQNITLLIDRPSVGIVGFNEWHWPNLDAAINDLYSQFKNHNPFVTKYDSYNIYVMLRVKSHDKYGNNTYEYEDSHKLVTISGDEIEKYQSASYMDNGLGLSSKIRDVVDKTTYTINFH